MKAKLFLPIIIAIAALLSCGVESREAEAVDASPAIFPDYVGVTIPPNIAPLNFKLKQEQPAVINICLQDESGDKKGKTLSLRSSKGYFMFSRRGWKKLMSEAAGKQLNISVSSKTDTGWVRYLAFPIYVAEEKIDPILVYRKIAPGYRMWNSMGIYQRNLESFSEKPILENKQTDNNCMNCHSFCAGDSEKMVFHQRATHAGTYICTEEGIEKLDTKTDSTISAFVYPYWHPGGRYLAFSTNDTKQDYHFTDPNRIEVFDTGSDVVIYDTKGHKIITSPLLSSAAHLETFPCFSPDGSKLYFCSADSLSMPQEYRKMRYSLLSMDFDPQSGQLGTTVDTLYNASLSWGSATFPRISPDGKYLIFTHSEYGTFPIWHKDADLRIVDLHTGGSLNVGSLNSDEVESYHSWSSNSRWIVFSSRRQNGLYTAPFMAYISPEGEVGKPFLLPQSSPDYYDIVLHSFNIPELVKSELRIDRAELVRISKYGNSKKL